MVGGSVDLAPGEIEGTRGQYVLAHNGWVMNADPLVNFAAEGSQVSPPYVCVCVLPSWFPGYIDTRMQHRDSIHRTAYM